MGSMETRAWSEEMNDFVYHWETYLNRLSSKKHYAELLQFLIDMMDWTGESDFEEVYISLEQFLKDKFAEKYGA